MSLPLRNLYKCKQVVYLLFLYFVYFILAVLLLPVYLFIRFFILHFVVAYLLLYLLLFLYWCCCYMRETRSIILAEGLQWTIMYVRMLLLYFCLFVDHVNKSIIFVFEAFVFHSNNTISIFVTLLFLLNNTIACLKFDIISLTLLVSLSQGQFNLIYSLYLIGLKNPFVGFQFWLFLLNVSTSSSTLTLVTTEYSYPFLS